MRVTIHRTLEAAQALAAEWRDMPFSNPFSQWEFARRGLDQASVRPFVITVRGADDRLLGLAPWCLRRQRGGIWQLEGIWGYDAWYHDPCFVVPALEGPVSILMVETLQKCRREWDTLALILRPEHSARLLEGLAGFGRGVTECPGDRQSHVVDLSEGWEAYWGCRSSKLRSSLRLAQRKLDALPHRYFEADAETYPVLLDMAIRMSQERWDPEQQRNDWYEAIRELAAWSAARGEGCAFGLEVSGRLAASKLLFRTGDRAFGTIQVYDPEFSRLQLGNLLNAWSFERLAAAGVRIVDLGDGGIDWKERMRTGVCQTVLVQLGTTLSGKALLGWRKLVKPQLAGIPGLSALRP